MAISDRITSIEEHIKESYQELEGIGIDTTEVDKNLENIPKLIDGYWETLPKVTGEGTSITLDNTKEGKMKIGLKGNTSQETTTGSQLIDFTTLGNANTTNSFINDILTINTSSGTYANAFKNITSIYKSNPSKVLRFDFTSLNSTTDLSGANGYVRLRIVKTDNSVTNVNLVNTDKSISTHTIPSDVSDISSVSLTIYANNTGTTITNTLTINKPILHFGSTSTDYEPYTNGASPNPDYPQDIHVVSGDNSIDVCGKNLLNLGNISGTSNQVQYSINSNGELVLNGACNSDRVTINLPTQQALNGIYTFSTNYIKATALKNSGGTNLFLTTSSNGVKTETINDTIAQLVIYGLTGVTFSNQIIQLQVEKGTTATTYEAYKGASYPINLGVENLINLNRAEGTYSGNGTSFEEGKYYPNMVRDSGNVGSTGEMVSCASDILTIRGRYGMGVGYPIKCKPNQDYYVKTTSSDSNARLWVSFYDSTGTYISGSPNNDSLERTITSPNNAYWIIPIFAVYGTSLVSVPFSNIKVLEGTKEQYISTTPIELCKIGDYQDSIKKSTGKNLFDKNTITTTTGWLIEDGTISTNHPDYYVSDFIPIKPNTAYYKTKTDSARTKFYDSNKQPLNTTSYQDISVGGNAGTFTTSNNAYYLRITINTSLSPLNSIMINEGTTALPYEPYGKVWYLNKQIGKVVLDGSENWIKKSDTGISVFVKAIAGRNVSLSSSSLSNYFKYQFANSVGKFYFGSSSSDNCAFCMEDGYTLETFKTWLSTHNVLVYYVLATPTYTEITDTTLINQLEALNGAKSYTTQTNINQENNDNASILNASALESM